MARFRIQCLIAQALLGLLLFAWLPAIDGASPPFLDDLGQVLSLAELPERGEADGEACPDAFEDGGGLDDIVLPGSSCSLTLSAAGQGWRRSIEAVGVPALPGVPHATGPPSFSK
ncbi:hypothetical protein ILT44_02765 [Microvirga sp. BT689]|uniref:hypothetical protein n=1 Tax=Microvirga arvi TaxID=2778731 RepID=UPI0019516D31|nr:hypothetical protein [Microvirga arvi]MBM6579092.1 hypothetical protein [Microvirga arvi]